MPLRNPFTNINRMTKEVKHQEVQFKILHNIYPSNALLYKWRLKETDKCEHCNEKDDLKHSIFECTIAKESLENFVISINDKLKIRLNNISYQKLLFGNSTYERLNIEEYQLVDTLLVIIKHRLLTQRDCKYVLNVRCISKIIDEQHRLEKKILSSAAYKKRWRHYVEES
jgi:hypothetical protein